MANLSRLADYYGSYSNSAWSGWTKGSSGGTILSGMTPWRAWRLDFPLTATAVSSAGISMSVKMDSDTSFPLTLRCYLYKGDNPAASTGSAVSYKDVTISNTNQTTANFSFSGLSVTNATKLSFRVGPVGTGISYRGTLGSGTVTASYTPAALGISVSTPSVTVGSKVSMSFSNRAGQNISLIFRHDDTDLHTVTASGDSLSVTCPESWFTDHGITDLSMDVAILASDGLGRDASASFTLSRQQASPATPTSPGSGASVSGSGQISFGWTVDTTRGAQTKAELQWSADQTAWNDLGTVTGTGTSYKAAAYTFPAGRVYWRVRTVNTYGITSGWAQANFTVTYAELSVGLSPATVYAGEAVTVTLTNRLSRTVGLRFAYGSVELGTATASGDTLAVTCPESWFTDHAIQQTSISVSVTATDEELGRTASASFTLKTRQSSPATAVSPKSASVSGSGQITFTWETDDTNGAQTKAELQWSTDQSTWTSLGTVNGTGTSLKAAAYKFQAGTVYWRVRATNSRGVVSAWNSASFTVSYAVLAVVPSPTTVYVGSKVTVGFSDTRLGRTVTLTLTCGQTQLTTVQATGDVQITCPQDWFTRASQTGNSMRVDIAAADTLGRTASAYFTLYKILPSPATPTAPKNTDVNTFGYVTFSWTVDETHGTQTKAEVQWSTDAVAWTNLGPVSTAKSTTISPRDLFPVGRIYWRVRTTNSNGSVSDWSTPVYFTAAPPEISLSPSPASLNMGDSTTVSVTNWSAHIITVTLKSGDVTLQPSVDINDNTAHQFKITTNPDWFITAGQTGSSLQVDVNVVDNVGRTATTRLTVAKTAATLALSPASVYAGEQVQTTVGNTRNYAFSLTFRYQNTELASYSYAGSSVGDGTRSITCPVSWFDIAGVSGSSMSVTVVYADALSRTTSTSFTLQKKQPSPATPQAPKSTDVSGNAAITFTWTVDTTHGAQTKAELQWSTDATVWTELGSVSGDAATWTQSKTKFFPAGRIYWRIRTVNTLGQTSAWSAAVNFNITYPALSLSPSPASLDMGAASTVSVTNRLSQKLTVTVKNGSTILVPAYSVTADSFKVTTSPEWFITAGVTGNSLQADVTATDPLGRTATARLTVAKPAATLSLSPSSVYTGNKLQVTVGNTFSYAFSLTFKFQSTVLETITYTGSSVGDGTRSITCPATWFDVAGQAGSSMSVTVTYADSLSRTVNASFTLVKPQGSTFTCTAPRQTSVDGAGQISFAWTVSSDWGSQTKAELQWSTDNASWEPLATINGAAPTWKAPAVSFPAGTVYWRGRVTNSFGVLGSWSNSVNFTAVYSATSQVTPVNSPTGGIVNASEPITFSVELVPSAPVYSPFQVATATFFWRMAEEGGAFSEVSMTAAGSGASVTIPAGTFSFGFVQWYATATDTTGHESQTAYYTVQAGTAVVDAVPVSPISTVESGSGPITFRWQYGSLDGSPQTAAQLQRSADGTTWSSLGSVTGTAREWTAAADTIPAGTVWWRVRAENSAGTWGPWSKAVSFVCFAAPTILSVSADSNALVTVSWQVEGQLAYEIRVDGTPDWKDYYIKDLQHPLIELPKTYGPYFGADARSFTLPDYLPTGTYTMSVRAQNSYGLWSEWAAATSVRPAQLANLSSGFDVAATSPSVSLSPEALFAVSPIILQQPTDMQGTSGTVTFSVVIDDYWRDLLQDAMEMFEGMSFVWETRLGDGAWSPVPDSDSPELTVPCSEADDGREYRCRIYSPGYRLDSTSYGVFSAAEACSETAQYFFRDPAGPVRPPVTGFFPGYGVFRLYRDGVPIAESYTGNFVDRAALGPHEYVVLQQNSATQFSTSWIYVRTEGQGPITSTVPCPMIAPLSGGEFMPLPLSASAGRAETVTRQREVAYIQYAGDRWPTAEIGEHESLTAAFDCAWMHDEAELALAFEELLGREVILKLPGGVCAVGVLAGFERRDPRWFRSYSCTIRQSEWRDFTDATRP